MKVIYVGTRFIVLELDNHLPYFNDSLYDIYVNDKFYQKSDKNVISLYDLTPNTNYKIKVLGEELSVKTAKETICLETDLFNTYKDGINDDTIKLQQAILACPEGGTVYVNKGTYLITSLFLKSNFNLYFEDGVKFITQYDRKHFPVLPGIINNSENELNLGSFEGQELNTFSSCITGINVSNVTVAGKADIDMQATLGDWYKNHNEVRIACRPYGVFLNRCDNIVMAGFFIHDTPCWNIHPYFSSNLQFLDLRIENPVGMPTTDGLDPDACSDVLILGCEFKVGDDCIAIKSGTIDFAKKYLRPSSNITIRNCYMAQGHGGVVFGSESSGGIKNVIVSQSLFVGTDRGLRIKTRRGRGRYGIISNITFDNIRMDGVLTPFVVNMFYNMGPKGGHDPFVWSPDKQKVDMSTPIIEDFTFSNIICDNVALAAGVFLGLPEEPIKKITFKNVHFNYNLNAKPGYPVMVEHKELMQRKGVVASNVLEIVLDDVTFNGNIGLEVESNGKIETL